MPCSKKKTQSNASYHHRRPRLKPAGLSSLYLLACVRLMRFVGPGADLQFFCLQRFGFARTLSFGFPPPQGGRYFSSLVTHPHAAA